MENPLGQADINVAPILLRGEDLYLRSGSFALTTDNAKNTYFDGVKIWPIDCFVDPFDPEQAIHYKVKTNRFRDMFVNDISLVWR